MPDVERGRLRVAAESGQAVSDTIHFLEVIRTAYNGILAIAAVLDGYIEPSKLRRYATPPVWELNFLPYQSISSPDLSDEAIAGIIPPQDQLLLWQVRLSSPGFWEFVGLLNPLEVVRRFINDCHHRRQDREYRETFERRNLELQNEIVETGMLRERIELARSLGVPEHHLTYLMNRLVYGPLQQIEILCDRGMILPSSDSSEEETRIQASGSPPAGDT